MYKDLTVGKPDKVLWKFCLPLFGSVVFQQLYNISDSLVAGRMIGEAALASVGNGYQITLIFMAFAFGCNIGCSVIVSQLFGAGKRKEMKTAIYTTWIASAILCAVLVFGGLLFSNTILHAIHTPRGIFSESKLYLDIYIIGFPFLLFYNVATGIFSAIGDARTPFCFLAVSSVSNILVNICFVKFFHMKVDGIAWATFLCQGISCILAVLAVLRRLNELGIKEKCDYFSFPILKKIASIAIPSILQQSFISLGNIIIQGTINTFGEGVIAGYSASVKLNNLVITSFTTIGNGISNFTAQNLGAGKIERIKEGFRSGVKLVWMLCVPIVAVYLLCTATLVQFFLEEPSKDALHTGVMFLYILAPFYFVISVKLMADGVLRGIGLMKRFLFSTFADLILRVVLALVFSGLFGETGIWCAWPIGWTIATFLSLVLMKSYRRSDV